MAHEGPYDLQVGGQLLDGAACVYRIQHIAGIGEVLEKIQGSACDPWPDLLEILRGMEFSDHGGPEFIGNGAVF